MRYTKDETNEIIPLEEGSDPVVNRTPKELGPHKRTFYNWYKMYRKQGEKGPESHPAVKNRIWNEIAPLQKEQVVHLALQLPQYSFREVATHITGFRNTFISESSVYRIPRSNAVSGIPIACCR